VSRWLFESGQLIVPLTDAEMTGFEVRLAPLLAH